MYSANPQTQLPVATPITTEESGLSLAMLEDIVARQMFDTGVIDTFTLEATTALSGRLLEQIIGIMRADARIEVLGPGNDGSNALRYSLTDAGRKFALDARERSGYVGPAPISETHYRSLIQAQSVHNLSVSREQIRNAYTDVVIKPELQDKLGAAMHSSKAILIYGPAGTGKTFLCSRLIRLLDSPVYIPHAVAVGDSIVRVFDASVHIPVSSCLLYTSPSPRDS